MPTTPNPDPVVGIIAAVSQRVSRKAHPNVPDSIFFFAIGQAGGFWVVTQKGMSGVYRTDPGRADTVIRIQDMPTAQAIVNGQMSAVRAFLSGRIKVEGNASLASQHLGELLGP